MSVARFLGGLAASAAVAGCAVVALGMARDSTGAATARPSARDAFSMPVVPSTHPAFATLSSSAVPSATGHPSARAVTSSAAPRTTATSVVPATSTVRSSTAVPPGSTTAGVHAAPKSAPKPSVDPSLRAAPKPAAVVRGVALPLRYSTGTATRVITVTAHSRGSTTATLQAWTKASGGGWLRYGTSVTAHIGAQGMTTTPSESKSASPMGSFTLTQAFGRMSDPGTALPYFRTTPADWWISQSGRLYNTHQHCSSGCPFTRGDPNEHLYYETPYYNYAVVIDYNTRNAPGGVRQGAGSAFFLHVTDGAPTAGCVAIAQSRLITLMRWLSPTAHPRILIGTV